MSKPQRNSARVINNATTWALSVFESDLSPTQKLICLYLRTHMNSYQEIAWPSKARIAAKCGITERCVYENMPKICESGYLIANGTGPKGTIRYEICTPELGSPLNYVPNTPERGSPELTNELTNSIRGWGEWVQYRKEKKKTLTPSTIKKQVAMLEKYSPDEQESIINQSITNGWTGLFEVKNENSKGNSRNYQPKPTAASAAQKLRDRLAEHDSAMAKDVGDVRHTLD